MKTALAVKHMALLKNISITSITASAIASAAVRWERIHIRNIIDHLVSAGGVLVPRPSSLSTSIVPSCVSIIAFASSGGAIYPQETAKALRDVPRSALKCTEMS